METKDKVFGTFFKRVLFAGFVLAILNIIFFYIIGRGFGRMSNTISKWEVIKNNFTNPGWDYVFLNVLLMLAVYIIINLNDIYWKSKIENQNSQKSQLIIFLSNFITAYLVFSWVFWMDLFGSIKKDSFLIEILRIDYSFLAALAALLLIHIRNKHDPVKIVFKYFGVFFSLLLFINLMKVGVHGDLMKIGLKDDFTYKVDWDVAFELITLYPLFGICFLAILEMIIVKLEKKFIEPQVIEDKSKVE